MIIEKNKKMGYYIGVDSYYLYLILNKKPNTPVNA